MDQEGHHDRYDDQREHIFILYIHFLHEGKDSHFFSTRAETYIPGRKRGFVSFTRAYIFKERLVSVHLLSDRDQDRMEGLLPIPFTGTAPGSQMDKSAKSFS